MSLTTPRRRAGERGDLAAEQPRRRLNPRIIDTDWLVMRALRKAIERLTQDVVVRGMEAIDFGCGSSPYRALFEARGAIYRGADFAGAEIAIDAAGRLAAADDSADLVLSFQVLEHVRELSRYLGEARRVLRRQGRLVLSTHGNWLYHPHPEDHRRWTRQGLAAELASNGFEVMDCVPLIGPLGWTTMMRLVCGYHVCLKLPLVGRLLAKTLAVVMNVKALAEEAVTPAWVRRDNACVYVTLSRLAPRVS